MTLTSKERAALRSQANQLAVTVHVGHQGLTDALRQSLDDALRTKELVKVQFSKNAEMDAKTSAKVLAVSVGADVVQTIGRTATFFRKKPEDD